MLSKKSRFYGGMTLALVAAIAVLIVFSSISVSAGHSKHTSLKNAQCTRFANEATKINCAWTPYKHVRSFIVNGQGNRACSQLKRIFVESGRCDIQRSFPNTCNAWGNKGLCTTDVNCVSPASAFVEPSPDGNCLSGQGCCILA